MTLSVSDPVSDPSSVHECIDTRRTLASVSLISAAASTIFLIMPILLGAAVDYLHFDAEQAGLIASSYFLGFLLICLSTVFWIRRFNWRYTSASGFVLLTAGLGLAANVSDYSVLLSLMIISGIGAGIIYSLAVCIVTDSQNPDRFFAIKLVTEQAIGATLLFLLPIYITERWSFPGLMLTTAVVMALLGLASYWLPAQGRSDRQHQKIQFTGKANGLVWLSLLALMIYFAGLSGLWAFIERMATDQGIAAADIGKALSLSLIGGGLGAFAAALQGERFGRLLPLLISSTALLAVIYFYSEPLDALLFAGTTFVFSAMWNYGLAYQMGLVVSLDRQGQLSVLISSFLSLGAIIGPGIAGSLITGQGYSALFAFTTVSIISGLLVFGLLLSRVRQGVLAESLSE